jgi:streptogramin lyase
VKRLPVFACVLAAASLAVACSPAGTPLSAPSGLRVASPQILQGDDGKRWMTISGLGRGVPYPANVLARNGIVYTVAGWGKSHSYEGFATIDMHGKVRHAPRQPKCAYSGSTLGAYDMYAYDIALNHEGNAVFTNPDVTFPGSQEEFGWTFVSPSSGKSACYLAAVSGGNLTVLATGPEDTIWGAGATSPYLWRFSPDGTATNFPLPAGVSAFESVVEGPDHVMWAQPFNTQTVMRISPGNGKVLSTYDVPCAVPVNALAVASGLVWGYANGCIYSISSSGVASSYTASGVIAQDSPHAIAAGPDGNPWFVALRKSREEIGTVDGSTGKSKFFALPSGAGSGLSLATGPDRNVWVMDENDDLYVYIASPLSVDPRSVTFPQVRAVARLTVTQRGTTKWRASSADTSIARIGATSIPSVFKVTATGSGTTTLTIEDTVGNSVVVPVTVE